MKQDPPDMVIAKKKPVIFKIIGFFPNIEYYIRPFNPTV